MGYLFFIDGVGLEEIGFIEFEVCFVVGGINEVIFVINLIVEGEVMVYYIV